MPTTKRYYSRAGKLHSWRITNCKICGKFLEKGKRNVCSECSSINTYKNKQKWKLENRNYIREYEKKYRLKNKGIIKEHRHNYYLIHRK